MAETLTDPQRHGNMPEATAPQATPEADAQGFRANVRAAGEHAYSFADLSAGITLASREIRGKQGSLDTLNTRYGGILERQTASDVVSVALEADLILDYRRDAQRAGYTDVDAMPAELRLQVVENAVRNRADDIIAELESHHPDWTREQLAEAAALRISDIITLLSMSGEQRDDYRRALFNYRDTQGDIAALETKLETLREARRDRLGALGRVAVGAVVGMVNAVRNAPHAVASHVTVAGMTLRQKVGEWYQSRSPEGKRTTIFSAATLAIAGIATYMSMRYAAGYEGAGSRSADFTLASNNTDTGGIGGQAPEVSGPIGGVASEVNGPIGEAGVVGPIGGVAPEVAGPIGYPNAEVIPGPIGGSATEVTGPIGDPGNTPEFTGTIGGHAPEKVDGPIGNPAEAVPEVAGGDLRTAKTSSELFGNGNVQHWPETVKVSAWDSQTKDGSLWGISEEMLQRSGVANPSDAQIDKLVDALRPQADANGFLQKGQELNLRPAIDLLPSFSK